MAAKLFDSLSVTFNANNFDAFDGFNGYDNCALGRVRFISDSTLLWLGILSSLQENKFVTAELPRLF